MKIITTVTTVIYLYNSFNEIPLIIFQIININENRVININGKNNIKIASKKKKLIDSSFYTVNTPRFLKKHSKLKKLSPDSPID